MAEIVGLVDAPPLAVSDQSRIGKFERMSAVCLPRIEHPTEFIRIWRSAQQFRDLERKEQSLRPK